MTADASPRGGMRVARADNGFDESLETLKRTVEEPLLRSVDERGRLVRRRSSGAVTVRSREVHRINLASGRQLELASDQQVLEADSWVPVSHLASGSRIGVVRRLGAPTDRNAWMIQRLSCWRT